MEEIKRPLKKPVTNLKKSLIILFSSIITVFIILIGVYFYLGSSKPAPNEVKTNIKKGLTAAVKTQSPSPTPLFTSPKSSTSAQITDWKTYTNKELNFSFKYPGEPNWQIKESETGIMPDIYRLPTLYNYDVDNAPGRDYIPAVDGDIFKVEIRISSGKNLNQWLEEEKGNATSMSTGQPAEIRNTKQMKIDEKNAVYFEIKTITGLYCPVVAIEFSQNRLLHLNPGLSCEKFQPTFDQTLSTFKFTK